MIVIKKVSPFVLAVAWLLMPMVERAQAGAFLLEPGAWQVIHTWRVSGSRLKYDGKGRLNPEPFYGKVEAATLIEYGFNRDLTILLMPVGRYVTQDGPPLAQAWALGSLDVGARWRVQDFGPAILSFQGLFRVPARSDPAFLPENRARSELRLAWGRSGMTWLGRDAFADFSVAWVRPGEPWHDEWHLDLTYGWRQWSNQLLLMQWFQTFYRTAPGEPRASSQTKLEASTLTQLGRGWSLQLGSFASIGGVSTRFERGTIVGLWRQF